ncbi:MAG: hypothetical protein KF865_06120 [Bdellovibrionaceae bacterium]|nr:hypothetical protein [Pseudobdellovibrionaceae bacterium]
MKLEIADPAEGAELSAFFKRFHLRGPAEIRVDRGGDFFGPARIQSDTHVTYTLKDENKSEILGVASFAIGETLAGGAPARVAFGRDLRILETRQAVLGWSQHFLPVMEEVRRVFQVDHFMSVMNLHENKAMNAFMRPRPGKRPFPRYFLHRRFNVVSLHGRFPWAPTPLPSVRIRRGAAHLQDALIHYIVRKSRERDFLTSITPEAFMDLLGRWQGLKLEDFLVALDHQDNVIGCCAPWSAGGLEEYIPLKYNLVAHNFRQFLKFGRIFGWTRALTKPVHRLKMEAGLNFRYLCFLFADNEDIFESLAWIAYEEARENEFLVYTQMRSDLHLRRPLTWVSAKLPYALYSLCPPDAEPPAFLHPSQDRPAGIEPFFA